MSGRRAEPRRFFADAVAAMSAPMPDAVRRGEVKPRLTGEVKPRLTAAECVLLERIYRRYDAEGFRGAWNDGLGWLAAFVASHAPLGVPVGAWAELARNGFLAAGAVAHLCDPPGVRPPVPRLTPAAEVFDRWRDVERRRRQRTEERAWA